MIIAYLKFKRMQTKLKKVYTLIYVLVSRSVYHSVPKHKLHRHNHHKKFCVEEMLYLFFNLNDAIYIHE